MSIYMQREPNYLCFTANTAWSTVALTKTWSPTSITLETSSDWNNWTTHTIGSTITLSNVWDKVYFRNTSTTTTWFTTASANRYQFSLGGSINASWDITYLINKNSTKVLPANWCFYNLFRSQTALRTTPELPATTLTDYCYYYMFWWCSNLTTPPKVLPAMSVPTSAYGYMFRDSWITVAPKLPATTLTGNSNYISMFQSTKITDAPELPATVLTNSCYNYMFANCANLVTPPALPAVTLVSKCYQCMFQDCTSLETLCSIPALDIDGKCNQMYQWCTKIKLSTTQTWAYQTVYRVPIIWSWSGSLNNMFLSTWWTFTGTPTVNTNYYTSNVIVI